MHSLAGRGPSQTSSRQKLLECGLMSIVAGLSMRSPVTADGLPADSICTKKSWYHSNRAHISKHRPCQVSCYSAAFRSRILSRTLAAEHQHGPERTEEQLTTRYFSTPSISTELTTLSTFVVGS